MEIDTVRGANENWISGKNLIDVVTTLALGLGKTMTAPRERAADEEAIRRVSESFFGALSQEFADLRLIANGELRPVALRGNSLLASPTIIRALAGAYYDVAVDSATGSPVVSPSGDRRMRKLFSDLSPRMGLPVDDGWFATGLFDGRTSQAPGSRTQDIKELAAILRERALTAGALQI
ncbi:hypothetical protein [Paraoerskovia sediminicola]|nr:hypothetical protein [Paraoerskovia sediminicola]